MTSDMKALPIPVSLIGFGHKYHDGVIKDAAEKIGCRFMVYDVRKHMRDPLQDHRVGWHEDASHPKTVLAVYGQDGFYDAIYDSVWNMMEHLSNIEDGSSRGVVLAGGCNSGYHRADTWKETMRDLLNSIHFKGVRLFNAQSFSLVHALKREQPTIIKDALQWSEAPWSLVDGPVDRRDRFGFTAVQSTQKSQLNWNDIWNTLEHLDSTWERELSRLSGIPMHENAKANDAVDDTPPRKHRRLQVPQISGRPASSSNRQRSPERARSRTPVRPRAPAMPPPEHLSRKRESWQPQRSRSRTRSRTAVRPRAPAIPPPEHLSRKRERWQPPMTREEWKSFEWKPEAWADVLANHGVDRVAQQELLLLAQRDTEGKFAANTIISKFLSKVINKETVMNPSAFIHSCCRKARVDYFGEQ